MKRTQQGFTLIELMIAVVVVGILSAIAIPNYRSYVQKAERGAAKAVMVDLAQTEERYFTNNGAYLAIAALPTAAPAGWQNYSGSSTNSARYSIVVTAGSVNGNSTTSPPITDGYLITARPIPADRDPICGILRLDSTGAKAASGTGGVAQCW